MVYCTGCGREFTASGYTSHVARTLNSACHTAYSQEMDALQGEDSNCDGHTGWESDGPGPHVDHTSLFHDSDGFFDDTNVGERDSVDSEWDSATDEQNERDSADEWDSMDEHDSVVDVPNCSQVPDSRANKVPLRFPVSASSTVMEKLEIEDFPEDSAGKPIDQPTLGRSGFMAYQSQLNGNSSYAPFASKTDWEVARWAKLHKISLAAITELLQIEGVCSPAICD